MKDQLEAWKSDPVYSEGIALYRKLGGDDPVLLTLFSLPETSYTRNKLEDALSALLDQTSEPPQPITLPEKTPKPVLDLIRKRSLLHQSLSHTPGATDRHTIAQAILTIGKKLDRYYDHGEVPQGEAENNTPEQDIPANAWELHQLINNNFAYMTKNKNREDKQGEVKRRERMNIEIEKRLKSINYETSGQST